MKRPPDVVIGEDYLLRWHVIPRNRLFNIYLHEFLGSDGPICHDHPWHSLSYMVQGYLWETHNCAPHESFEVCTGQWTYRKAECLHRLEVLKPGKTPVTLFITGPIIRMWGFQCPKGWVAFKDIKQNEYGQVDSAGCGEVFK